MTYLIAKDYGCCPAVCQQHSKWHWQQPIACQWLLDKRQTAHQTAKGKGVIWARRPDIMGHVDTDRLNFGERILVKSYVGKVIS